MDNNSVLVSCAIVCKEQKNKKIYWFLVKNTEGGDWEIPKAIVRKVESSVRAIIRMLGEQGSMSVQVLEEAGRAGGVTTVNGKTMPQRHLYYLAIHKASEGEAVGFEDFKWFDYASAVRKLTTKRERSMIKEARKELVKWQKEQKKIQELQRQQELLRNK